MRQTVLPIGVGSRRSRPVFCALTLLASVQVCAAQLQLPGDEASPLRFVEQSSETALSSLDEGRIDELKNDLAWIRADSSSQSEIFRCQIQLGRLDAAVGNLEPALQWFSSARESAEYPYQVAHALRKQSAMHLRMQNYEAAIGSLLEAYSALDPSQRFQRGAAMSVAAELIPLLKWTDRRNEASKIYRDLLDLVDIEDSWSILIQAARNENKLGNSDEAAKLYSRAADALEARRARQGVPRTSLFLSTEIEILDALSEDRNSREHLDALESLVAEYSECGSCTLRYQYTLASRRLLMLNDPNELEIARELDRLEAIITDPDVDDVLRPSKVHGTFKLALLTLVERAGIVDSERVCWLMDEYTRRFPESQEALGFVSHIQDLVAERPQADAGADAQSHVGDAEPLRQVPMLDGARVEKSEPVVSGQVGKEHSEEEQESLLNESGTTQRDAESVRGQPLVAEHEENGTNRRSWNWGLGVSAIVASCLAAVIVIWTRRG